MGDMIAFPGQEPEELAFDEMTEDQLWACLEELHQRIVELDEQEPRDMESEAYETWADAHEELEDLVDEILELLDE